MSQNLSVSPRPTQVSARIQDIRESPTVAIADMAHAMRRAGQEVIDLSAGRAAEATPLAITQAAQIAMQEGFTHQTPARGLPEFLQQVAAKIKRENGIQVSPEENVVATLGCKQGLTAALLSVVDPGCEVLIEDPCFPSYAPTIKMCGGQAKPVALSSDAGFQWTREDLESALTERTRVLLMCNPHNPTGAVAGPEYLGMISDFAQQNDLVVISDEIYERTVWGGREHRCIAALPEMLERTVTLMGVTKSHSMGGWRNGFAFSSREIIDAMVKAQQHLVTCASSFGQKATAFALSGDQSQAMDQTWSDWEERCRFMYSALDSLSVFSMPVPQAGFYLWIDVSRLGFNGDTFAERLLAECGIAVVPGSAFGQSSVNRVRITCVKSWDDLRKAVAKIKEFVSKVC